MSFFEEKEAEYQAAVAKQNAERRAETQAQRAKVKKEADKVTAELLDTFPPPPETVEPADDRDIMESTLNILASPGAKAQQMNEGRLQRRAEFLNSFRRAKPSRDGLALPDYLGSDLDIDSIPDEEEFEDFED